MALSAAFVDAHVRYWEQRLHSQWVPHRGKWPSKLFHHAPLENVVDILTAGMLRSRNDPANPHRADVAAAGVIDTNPFAHDYVRLYFRPCTPTQYNIEGVRRINECAYGAHAHAPMLFMLVLDARRVLTGAGVMVSNGNMQVRGVSYGDSEAFFATVPFADVFHEGAYGADRSEIKFHRCAEVMTPSPLTLDDTLLAICCRSIAERETLLHQMGATRGRWEHRIVISDNLKVFHRRHAFVREVALSRERLVLSINPRYDRGTIDLAVTVSNAADLPVLTQHYPELPSVPPHGDRWGIVQDFADGSYTVEVTIERQLAYRNQLAVGDVIF